MNQLPLPRFGLWALFAVTLMVALVVAWYANRYRQRREAAELLAKHGVHFYPEETAQPWYDRLPFLDPPPSIERIFVHTPKDLAALVPTLRALGTVHRVSFYKATAQDMELLSQIDSIRAVEAEQGLTIEQLRPLLYLPLEEYSVEGPDRNIPREQLELLLALPTLRRIGMAHGEAGAAPELRAKRPDVAYFITDFPP